MKSPKQDLLKSVKFEFGVSFRFLLHVKEKDRKFFGKNTIIF